MQRRYAGPGSALRPGPAAILALVLALAPALPAGGVLGADPAEEAGRIGIRTVDGVAEFYRTDTGERFVPRGVNYLDFARDELGDHPRRGVRHGYLRRRAGT